MNMATPKLYVLPMGEIENDLAWNIAVPKAGSVDEPHPKAEWIRVPCFSYLIEHPTLGRILFDLGAHPDDTTRLPEYARKHFPWFGSRQDTIGPKLAELGLKPNDIDLIIISHLHWDHCGGLCYFSNEAAGKKVLVGKKDFEFGLVSTHQASDQPFGGGGYYRDNFEVAGITFETVDPELGNLTLAPDLEIIHLGGHTPQVMGIVLQLANTGTVILPSDAIYMAGNFGPPPVAPGIVYDTLGFYKSVAVVRRLQETKQAKIFYPHDPEQMRELHFAPLFYD
jgi:N-acyl homoserine lactone hydrolase